MTAESPKVLRFACMIAFAAGLYGCATSEQPMPAAEPQKPVEAPAPAMAQPAPPAEAPAPSPAPQAAPQQPAPKVARKPARKRKPRAVKAEAPPAPPPPVAAPPAPSPEQERARRLDDYVAAMQKSVVTFNPPSPIQVGQRAVAPLSVEPPKEAAQLADDLRKSLAPGSNWKPSMRAQIAGADFDIAPVDGKDSGGVKEATGRTEWSWSIAARTPGTKRLTARLSLLLPDGATRELPAVERSVEAQATLLGRVGDLWNDYWLWIVGALVVVVGAIVLLGRRRGG